MSERLYLMIIGFAASVALGTLTAMILMTRPTAGDPWLTIGFFGAAFFVAACVGTLLMTLLWCRGGRCQDDHHPFVRALRHGIWIGLGVVGMMALMWHGYFTWFSALLVWGAVFLLEMRSVLVRNAW